MRWFFLQIFKVRFFLFLLLLFGTYYEYDQGLLTSIPLVRKSVRLQSSFVSEVKYMTDTALKNSDSVHTINCNTL